MTKEIYLAGGCFWGIEKLFSSLNGVISATSGYANGRADIIPTYNKVCSQPTGYKETVKVLYDEHLTSLEALLFAYFSVIDPTIPNRQGPDRGTQYQVGIYYTDKESESIVKRIADIERTAVSQFVVEIEPLANFFEAEEYHQRYLEKNPKGYCHINPLRILKLSQFSIKPEEYTKPAKKILQIKI